MLIKLKDYERIHQIITSVVTTEGEIPAHSCIKYSLIGAHILRTHYSLDAFVKCGLAIFPMENEEGIVFGERKDNKFYASEKKIHCWIEAEGWFIDFMAPEFKNLTQNPFIETPKMFQKKLSSMKKLDESGKVGQFYFLHSQELSEIVLTPYCKEPSIRNWAIYCSEWFKKYPQKVTNSEYIFNEAGHTKHIKIKPIKLRSNW